MGCNGSRRFIEHEGIIVLPPDSMANLEIATVLGRLCEVLASCESPAEGKFWLAAQEAGLELKSQYPVQGYHLDFACPSLAFGIEIDGHEYHKTQEQRAADARRDRKLLRRGWHVVRFTAAEIWRDVDACVREVAAMMRELAEEATA